MCSSLFIMRAVASSLSWIHLCTAPVAASATTCKFLVTPAPRSLRLPTRANNPTQPKKHDSEVGPSDLSASTGWSRAGEPSAQPLVNSGSTPRSLVHGKCPTLHATPPPVTDLLSAAAPALTSRPYGCAPADAKPHRAAPLTCVISPDPRLLLPPPLRARPGQSTTSPQEYTAHIHAIKKSTGRGGSAATPSSQRLGSRGPCVRAETSVRTPARVTRRATTREHASAPRTAVPAALTAGGRCWPTLRDPPGARCARQTAVCARGARDASSRATGTWSPRRIPAATAVGSLDAPRR